MLVIIGVAVHATIFSRAVEIQKELHTKQTALENLSSMHEAADGLPEKVASFNAAVTEQKERVDALTTDWMEDLKLRIAQLNELLEPGYRGVISAEESAPPPRSPVQQTQQGGPQGVEPHVLNVRKQLRKKFQEAGFATATAAGSPLEGAWGAVTLRTVDLLRTREPRRIGEYALTRARNLKS